MPLYTQPVQAYIGPRTGRLAVEKKTEAGTQLPTEDGVAMFEHLLNQAKEYGVPFTGYFAPLKLKNPTVEQIEKWQKANSDKTLAAVILDQKWGPSICFLENDDSYVRKQKVVL